MRKQLMITAALGLGLGTVLAAPAATADTLPAFCTVDGHILNAQAEYVTQGSVHRWIYASYEISGTGTGGKSNVNITIRERDPAGNDTFVFRRDSPDNIVQNVDYLVPLDNTPTRASMREFVTFRGIFDTAFTDEKCNAYTAKI
jgi:hypothetical protein